MARTECVIDASAERIFEVLLDPRNYGYWVVGSKAIRGVDPDWPKVGSRFHHTVGPGPIKIRDHTRIEEIDPPRRLRLRAKARPLGTAMVTMDLTPVAGEQRTRVVMTEDPADRLTALVFHPLTHLLVRKRNVVSLERLSELARGVGPSPEEAARP